MGLGAATFPLLVCDGNVELLLVELKLLFNDERLTLLPEWTQLLLCDETASGALLKPIDGRGIAGFINLSLRRP